MKVLIQKNIRTIFLVVLKNIRTIFLVVLPIKLFVFIIDLLSQLLFIGGENTAYEFIKAKKFNKNLIMTEEEEDLFQKIRVVGFVKNLLIMM